MKTITEILGGAQALLDISFDLENCFEEHLTDEHKTFPHILRVAEQFLPVYIRPQARTGRPPYPCRPFIIVYHVNRDSTILSYLRVLQEAPINIFFTC